MGRKNNRKPSDFDHYVHACIMIHHDCMEMHISSLTAVDRVRRVVSAPQHPAKHPGRKSVTIVTFSTKNLQRAEGVFVGKVK